MQSGLTHTARSTAIASLRDPDVRWPPEGGEPSEPGGVEAQPVQGLRQQLPVDRTRIGRSPRQLGRPDRGHQVPVRLARRSRPIQQPVQPGALVLAPVEVVPLTEQGKPDRAAIRELG